MPARQLLRLVAEGAVERARSRFGRAEPTSRTTIIDLDAAWEPVGDLTEDFDDKMAEFMAFDDSETKRNWLLED